MMPITHTKLNPAAPSFPPAGVAMAPKGGMPPTPPLEELLSDAEGDTSLKKFDMATLPEWALIEENEKLRVAALSLAKTSTRDEWIARLRQFSELLAPGFNIDSPTNAVERVAWVPLAVRQMPHTLQPDLTTHGATFSLDFIQNELRGVEWSPGFYYVHPKDRLEGSKATAYWILDADLDPYLPKRPGEHGAKLTPFFNSTLSESGTAPTEEDYMNTPVFIANNYTCEYRYFGHYSQTRFSDKLDYERMVDGTVPPFVLEVWAKNLTQKDVQPWVKDALRGHIWPKPTYLGPLPLDGASEIAGSDSPHAPVDGSSRSHERRVKKAIRRYTEELQEWEIDSKLKLSMLTEKDIHKLFRAADSDERVGLRLWFEYLQCTSYEDGFYERMLELKYNEHLQRGCAETLRECEAKGWRWQKVGKVSGSGHPITVDKLCPTLPRISMLAARKDSVTGFEQGTSPSKDPQPETNKVAAQHSSKEASTEKTAPNGLDDPASHPTQPQPQTLPPHLRGKAGKQVSSPSQVATQQPSPADTQQPKPFPTGDLEAAKSRASRFTKAKSRHSGVASARGRSNTPRPVDRNEPMNQGWARAGLDPEVDEADSRKGVSW